MVGSGIMTTCSEPSVIHGAVCVIVFVCVFMLDYKDMNIEKLYPGPIRHLCLRATRQY